MKDDDLWNSLHRYQSSWEFNLPNLAEHDQTAGLYTLPCEKWVPGTLTIWVWSSVSIHSMAPMGQEAKLISSRSKRFRTAKKMLYTQRIIHLNITFLAETLKKAEKQILHIGGATRYQLNHCHMMGDKLLWDWSIVGY